MVDALLQIIVPEQERFEGFTVEQSVHEFDGVAYPQGPLTVSFNGVCLKYDARSQPIEKFLPPDYIGVNWSWLRVTDETLESYGRSVNDPEDLGFSDKFEEAIRLLLGQFDRWVVAYLLQYDQIDSSYNLDVEDCVAKLRTLHKRDNPKEGFVAYS